MAFPELVRAVHHRLRHGLPLKWQLNSLGRTEDCYLFFFLVIDGGHGVTLTQVHRSWLNNCCLLVHLYKNILSI